MNLYFKKFLNPKSAQLNVDNNRSLATLADWIIGENQGTPACPKCGKPTILRTNRANGNKFYGCSGFPNCRGTIGYNPTVANSLQTTKSVDQPTVVAQPTNWIYAKLLSSNEDVVIKRTESGDWAYFGIINRKNNGVIKASEAQNNLQTYRVNNVPLTSTNPSIEDLNNRLGRTSNQNLSKSAKETKSRKSGIIPDHFISDEQKMVDQQFEQLMANSNQSHMMINALAGSGKTSLLNHIAEKYGNNQQKWLYLVFNTKNKVEAKEKFPTFVDVKTTNGFLGEVLKHRSNVTSMKQTERMSELSKYNRKGVEKEKIIEKARLLADGPEFSAMLDKHGIKSNINTSEYGRLSKTISSLLKSISIEFKEQVVKLAGLAKSFALDPRIVGDYLETELKKIMNQYDFETDLPDIKERINRYSDSYAANVIQALQEIMGYDFMLKNYKDEIIEGAIWLLVKTMPHATKQKYRQNNIDHDLGQLRDFNDDLWYAAIHANEINWPHYDVVMADEVQDFNEAQKIMLKKLHDAGAKIVAVGDPNQCHPAGTLIETTKKGKKPIEEINVDDEVVVYNTKKSYFPGTKSQGRKIEEISNRPYVGDLIVIQTDSECVKCTPNHRCLVKFNADKKYCLYLMVKGNQGRIGICRINYKNGFGISIRAKQEGADKAWLLDIFDNEHEARIAEYIVSLEHRIPQLIFKNNGQISPTDFYINEIYNKIGNNINRVLECLSAYGRMFEYPIWSKEKQERFGTIKRNYLGSKKTFITQACNLISKHMCVKTFNGDPHNGKWKKISVNREHFEGLVYSLRVSPTEDGKRLYIANNIVVHNSIYRFRGADSKAFSNIGNQLKDLSNNKNTNYQLTKNFRSRKAVIDFSNSETHVKNLIQGKKFNDGWDGEATKYEINYEDAFSKLQNEHKKGQLKQTAFIARTNEPLVHAALKLLAQGVPFIVIGKDIANDLKKHISKIIGRFGMNDEYSTNDLYEKIIEFSNNENDAHEGKATKKAYLNELKEITSALESSISQFEEENNGNGDIRQFKNWLSEKMGGLEVDENEKDLIAYREKIEKENPVILTTAHKSKGLEFSRVYILRYDRFPHPKAKREEDKAQEENAKYVALTRAEDEIHVLKLKGQPGVKDED